MAKLIHSMIRVFDEAHSVDFYSRVLGLKINDRLDFADFTLVYLGNSKAEFELELTVNKGRTKPYVIGDGYGHLAVSVDNLDAEHARLIDEGFSPRQIIEFGAEGKRVARFFFIADPDGYQIELLERSGRFT
ncbi:MAG: VOC family protein [Paracoccus sp. (in: a-proteobacteria)]